MAQTSFHEYIASLLVKKWAINWGIQPQGYYLYFLFNGEHLGIQHISARDQEKIMKIYDSQPDTLPY